LQWLQKRFRGGGEGDEILISSYKVLDVVMGSLAGDSHDRSTSPPTPALAVNIAVTLEDFPRSGNLT